MASLQPRGNSYIVRWREGRGAKWQTCTLPDEKLATEAKNLAEAHKHKITDAEVYKILLKYEQEVVETVSTPLLADWIEEWLRLKVDIEASTKKEYGRLLRGPWITRPVDDVPALAGIRVGEISRVAHVDPWKAGISGTLMPAGVRKHWTVVNMAVRDAAQRFQFENPFARPVGHQSNGLPTIQQYDAYFLSVKEAEILVAACPPRVRDLVIVALGTGMRIGELLGLRVGAISLSGEHPVIHVVKSLRQTGGLSAPKSRRGRRSIDLPPTVVEVLRRLIAGKSHKDFVFASPNGKPWNANNFRNRSWRYVVAAAQRCSVHPPAPKKVGNGSAVDQVKSLAVSTCGCATRLHQRPRFHDLRHSYVAYLIAAGFDFLAIQRLIGHASIKTTFDTYGHRLPHGDKERLAQLNKLLPGGAKAADLEEFERKRSKSSKKKTKKDMAPFIAGLKPVV